VCTGPKEIQLINDKDAMTTMVKELALDKLAMRAPHITNNVFKYFKKNIGIISANFHILYYVIKIMQAF
jgi:hypothetical protein